MHPTLTNPIEWTACVVVAISIAVVCLCDVLLNTRMLVEVRKNEKRLRIE